MTNAVALVISIMSSPPVSQPSTSKKDEIKNLFDFLLEQCQQAHSKFTNQGAMDLSLLSQVLVTSQALVQVSST
jgi:hypothetical protein